MEQNKVEILEALNNEKMYSLRGDEVGEMCSPEGNDTCRDGMSTVTEQVKKYRNRLKIRDSERFAENGQSPGMVV